MDGTATKAAGTAVSDRQRRSGQDSRSTGPPHPQHCGGKTLTAVQIVLGTTAAGVVLTPLWLRVGLAWAGL